MSLKCSLIGHEFEEREIERDRETRGDEVIVTTKEYDVCRLCGTRRLASENKEVTTDVTQEESEDAPESAPEATAAPDPDPDPDHPRVSEDPPSPDGHADPTHDDGIILDDGADQDDKWPDPQEDQSEAENSSDEDDTDEEYTPWPEQDGSDHGVDATSPSESGPDLDLDEAFSASGETTAATASTDMTAAEPAPTPADGIEGVALVCPECGMTDDTSTGSLRPGDICPECLNAYLSVDEERNK